MPIEIIGTVVIDDSRNITNIATAPGSAPNYFCRAWVNFNGTGTVAIRESGNVSSLTDNNTGQYTINFTTAMPDANYCVVLGGARTDNNTNTGGMGFSKAHTRTTSSVQFLTGDSTTGNTDHVIVDVAIFR